MKMNKGRQQTISYTHVGMRLVIGEGIGEGGCGGDKCEERKDVGNCSVDCGVDLS